MSKPSFNKRVTKMISQLVETAEVKDGQLTLDLNSVSGFESADKKLKESREFRNDLTVAAGHILLEKAKESFEADDDAEHLTNTFTFGDVDHTLRAHREFEAANDEGETTTYQNFLSVSTNDTLGDSLAILRDFHAKVEESDEVEDEAEEAVE